LLNVSSYALSDQIIAEYKIARASLKTHNFFETENYYFFKGVANFIDYEDEDEAEFLAEADAYEKLEILAYNNICWPKFISAETRINIFYDYLNTQPLMSQNEGFTIIKKKKNRDKNFEMIFLVAKDNTKIIFPTTKSLSLINEC
jgi:hypothetical protein